jgi:hypothetical protein
MRTLYASQQLVPQELAWSPSTPESLGGFDPHIAPNVTIGTDFREIYFSNNRPSGPRGFFEMQGDLYLAFQLDRRTTLYYDRGIESSYELFACHYITPGLYLKAGRFVPSEGWKFDDHTMFVRADLGFSPPAVSDVGLEMGTAAGGLDAQVALLNGNRGGTLDNDRELAGAVNAVYRLRAGPANLALGATAYHQPGTSLTVDVAGAYAYANWRGFTWVGQADFEWTKPAVGASARALATSHELSFLLRQGVELLATCDHFDPETDRDSGMKWRFGGGLHTMPTSYLVLEALYRANRVESGPALSEGAFDEGVLQLHVLY